MQEFLGLAYFAEIPAVVFDVQRAGPSTGHADPHAAMRPDLVRLCLARRHQARAACSRRIRPRPSSSGADAFDPRRPSAEPIFVMLDLDIGMNHRLCRAFKWDDSRNTTAAR